MRFSPRRACQPKAAVAMGNMVTRVLITDVLATRAGYPSWILWGNCLWASVAVRKNPAWPGTGWGKLSPISPMFSIIYSYIALAYPGNVTANWLVLNRVPSALSSSIIFPIHVAWSVRKQLCHCPPPQLV